MTRTRLWMLPLAFLATAACGPVQSLTVIWEANSEIEGARAADGHKHAPYEMVAAEEYLTKALEEQAFADYEPAIVFGTKARDLARQARERAVAASSRPTAPGTPPPADVDADGRGTPLQVIPVPETGGARPTPIIVPTPE